CNMLRLQSISLSGIVNSFEMTFGVCWLLQKERRKTSMETKNICVKIPEELHEKVREELKGTEMTIPQFLQKVIEKHFMKKGVEKMEAKSLAVQVSEELFNLLKERVEKEKRQRRGRFTQKDHLIEIIT